MVKISKMKDITLILKYLLQNDFGQFSELQSIYSPISKVKGIYSKFSTIFFKYLKIKNQLFLRINALRI